MFHSLIFNVEGRSLSRNLGPYRIAHWLRSRNWDVEVIDYILHWSLEELQELVRSRVTKNTKFFGFSFLFSPWTDTVESFTTWLKITYPDITIISGSSGLPKRNITVDYHIWGFGEFALDNLLTYLFSNGKRPICENIDGLKVINGTSYPAYPLEDYSVSYEDRDFIQPWEFLAIETARGCKFKCSFCNFTVLGVKGDYSISAESFRKQLTENWEKWGVKNYLIAEETFNDNPSKISKFAKVISDLDFNPWFSAYIRLDLLISRKNERQMLKDMNVLGQFYGVESFHYPTAKAVRKGLATEKVKEGLIELKEFFSDTKKYRGTISLIIGAPLESKESFYSSIDWLVQNWKDQSTAAYPLGIPLKANNTRPSDLSNSYSDYGYEPISLKELELKHKNKDDIINIIKSKSNNLIWKSPYMDIVEAYDIQKSFQKTIKNYNFKKTTFALAEFSGINSTLEDKLTHTANEVHGWQKEEFEWYNTYKLKKLCWMQ